ncbi:MAG: leucyl/phenylalanyl-tRNA--protein transferase [Alphaproteobacteria bacterium]|jgi:leucyl/phenylalanyl-tRNA--protein transferase|nr:leucyl/phenylalanyl-tRNA--protein transferase [Alphaproteobacteria bacterium]MDP6816374.1 leucyl/phenylalanyl-tRNA--protein transferase [Alphaproteobacteria bacterium]
MRITPDIVLKAYAAGVFPMSESRDDPNLFWVDPEQRGVLPLDDFHLSRRLRRTVRAEPFEISVDGAFARVIDGCAGPGPGRWSTWINESIVELFTTLHQRGFAHSVEAWSDDELAGGLYGIALGGAFFGESMFSRHKDASKVALVHLVARLRLAGFSLLDTQFVTEHLRQFGAVEIARDDYHSRLEAALSRPVDFSLGGRRLSAAEVLQSIVQTS